MTPRTAEPPTAPWVGTAGVPARPPLRWQPPPPGPLARWHAKRQYGRQIARGQRVSPSRGPLVVVGLLATLIAICAIGGILFGISTGSASTPGPARTTPHPATTTHPGTKPGTHPAPKPTPKPSAKPTTGRPKPSGTHRS